jgi:prepilin-type N-terminal cleavage/methylation domain-containing protein
MRSNPRAWRAADGFTLIEMLLVLAILGILAGIAAVAVPAIMERARHTADLTNLDALNTITDHYIMAEDKGSEVFDPESSDNEKLLLLIDEGYLSSLPVAREPGVAFVWDEDKDVWTLGAASALTPLGSTFAEISRGFIELVEEYYAAHGHYPSFLADYGFTPISGWTRMISPSR